MRTFFIGLFSFFILVQALFATGYRLSKGIVVPHAGVACAEWHAAEVGTRILAQGGNAVDAAVAVAFALAVTYPRAGNLGGGGFLIFWDQKKQQAYALDFREKAPAKATPTMYWDENGKPNAELSRVGALAAGIPGTVRGLVMAHQKWGKLPWEKLVQPAIALAQNGFVVDSSLYRSLVAKKEKFARFPESMAVFFPGGKPPQPGTLFRQPDLARTLQKIASEKDKGFYEGEVARKIVATVQKYGGIFTLDDLKNYRAVERKPVEIHYRGVTIYSMPPPSSGGLVLQGILNTLARVPLKEKFAPNSANYIATISEIEKFWYAKRNLYLGDPDYVTIPFSLFSNPQVVSKILAQISPQHPYPARRLPEFHQIQQEAQETTHLSVVDVQGNAVSLTYTLNGLYGCYLVAEGTGVLLNNEMDDFAARPGYPNMFGLIQGKANAIAPGKRMLSSMTPTIVTKNKKLMGVVGTPGGSTIITSVLQVLLNKIDYGMSLLAAVSAGRFHQQWLPDSIYIETASFQPATLDTLKKRGFGIVPVKAMGNVQAIWKHSAGWEIVSDPRRSGFPAGF